MNKVKPSESFRISDAIRHAAERELRKMEEGGHISSGWTGEALASWIVPGITRSVLRALSKHRDHPEGGG